MQPDAKKDLTILVRQIQWEYKLDQYSSSQLSKLRKTLGVAKKEIGVKLESAAGGKWTRGREKAALAEINGILLGVQEKLGTDIEKASKKVAQEALKEYSNIVSFNGRIKVANMVSLSSEQLASMVKMPLGGHKLDTWTRKIMTNAQKKFLNEQMIVAALRGESSGQMAKRLADTFEMTRKQAETLALTYMAEANNAASNAVFDANEDIIKKVKWNACLEVNKFHGRGTCLRCAALDGRVFDRKEQHIEPPLHPRCRCFFSPVTASYEELGLDIGEIDEVAKPYVVRNKSALEHYGFYSGDFESWLKTRPDSYTKDLLGPTRYALYKEGKIKFSSLIDKHGNLRLLNADKTGILMTTGEMAKGWSITNPTLTKPKRKTAPKLPEPAIDEETSIDRQQAFARMSELASLSSEEGSKTLIQGALADIAENAPASKVRQTLDFMERVAYIEKNTQTTFEWTVGNGSKELGSQFFAELEDKIKKKVKNMSTFEKNFLAGEEYLNASRTMPGHYNWVNNTKYGNWHNGHTLKLLEEMVVTDSPLKEYGIFPRAGAGRPLSGTVRKNLADLLVETEAMKRKEFAFLKAGDVLSALEEAGESVSSFSLGEEVVSQLDFEKNVYLRRNGSFASFGIDKNAGSLFDAVGKKIDLGYCSFSDVNFEWSSEARCLVEVPKDQAHKYLKDNTTLAKLRRGEDLTTHLPHETEREVVLKNFYKIKSMVVPKSGSFRLRKTVIMTPIDEEQFFVN